MTLGLSAELIADGYRSLTVRELKAVSSVLRQFDPEINLQNTGPTVYVRIKHYLGRLQHTNWQPYFGHAIVTT